MQIKKININQDILKLIAVVAMTIDHISLFFPDLWNPLVGRLVGRVSFPIFGFLLMEHLYKKQIFSKYSIRLACFGELTALILFPFQYYFDFPLFFPFNILITFLWAVFGIWVVEFILEQKLSRYFISDFACLDLLWYFFCFMPVSTLWICLFNRTLFLLSKKI